MTVITKTAIVPYDSDKMLSLVNDIEKYPEFLKWCKSGYIERTFTGGYVAGMTIKISGIKVDFSTENKIEVDGNITRMYMSLVKGPFRNLTGEWFFMQYPEFGSKVELQLQYEVRSKMLGRVFTKGFDQVAAQLVNEFVNRAGVVYAKR